MTFDEIRPARPEKWWFFGSLHDISGKTPVVTADEDSDGVGLIYECDELNNAETWSRRVCL